MRAPRSAPYPDKLAQSGLLLATTLHPGTILPAHGRIALRVPIGRLSPSSPCPVQPLKAAPRSWSGRFPGASRSFHLRGGNRRRRILPRHHNASRRRPQANRTLARLSAAEGAGITFFRAPFLRGDSTPGNERQRVAAPVWCVCDLILESPPEKAPIFSLIPRSRAQRGVPKDAPCTFRASCTDVGFTRHRANRRKSAKTDLR